MRVIAGIAALPLCIVLAACSAAGPAPTTEPTTAAPVPTAGPSSDPPGEPGDTVGETPIRIVIGERSLDAALGDSPAARSLLEQLPLTLDFSDYGGQEVLAAPPEPLTMEGMPAGESAPEGTIGYYAPAASIVLYYSDVGLYPGIVRIGRMDGDLSILRGWDGPRTVTIELAG